MSREDKLAREHPPKRGERLLTRRRAMEIAHLERDALAVIQGARMKSYTRQGIHRAIRTSNIINDFFEHEHFDGKPILDLGPGDYRFSMLARHLGAEVICVEREHHHAELGRHLGFSVLEVDFEQLTAEILGQQANGVWMKNASNSCAYKNVSQVDSFVARVTSLITPEGWGWMVPHNKATWLEGEERERFEDNRIEAQRTAFERHGWTSVLIEDTDRKRYALSAAGSRYLYLRNLEPAT